jgi:hypothetical protein
VSGQMPLNDPAEYALLYFHSFPTSLAFWRRSGFRPNRITTKILW